MWDVKVVADVETATGTAACTWAVAGCGRQRRGEAEERELRDTKLRVAGAGQRRGRMWDMKVVTDGGDGDGDDGVYLAAVRPRPRPARRGPPRLPLGQRHRVHRHRLRRRDHVLPCLP
uniref:Uncharacterized protein n=1 Tax=Oryza meridionalis TaxID=40149 RepID=A0A0E0ELA4_9ORYZ